MTEKSEPADGVEGDGLEHKIMEQRTESFDAAGFRGRIRGRQLQASRAAGLLARPPRSVLHCQKVDRAQLLTDDEYRVTPTKPLDPDISFGFVPGASARIETNEPACLVIPIDPKADRDRDETKELDLDLDTTRLFVWDAKAETYHLIGRSGVHRLADGQLVLWAAEVTSGDYAAIALPRDPLVLGTIRVFCDSGEVFRRLDPPGRAELTDRICHLILCAGNMAAVADEIEMFDGRPRGEFDFPDSGPGGDLCERCTGIRVPSTGYLPECQIFTPPSPRPRDCERHWRPMGPVNISGAIRHIAWEPGSVDTVYAAGPNCGLWRLESVATYPATGWEALTDFEETLMVRGFAIAPSDPQRIYLLDIRDRMVRSDDRGQTWSIVSSDVLNVQTATRRIIVHPFDPDTVIAAVANGLFASFNGGVDWEQLLAGDVTDVAMDPLDSSILYAAVKNQGIEKSFNLGQTWNPVLDWSEATDPESTVILLALGRNNADGATQNDLNRTVVAKLGSEVFVNDHGGRTDTEPWRSAGKRGGTGYGAWCHTLAVDPFDPDVILAGAQTLCRTDNGGDSWNCFPFFHPYHEDHHDLSFHPDRQGELVLANDGGAFRSNDSGATWHDENTSPADNVGAGLDLRRGLQTAEFYRIGINGNLAVGNLFHSGLIGATSIASRSWAGAEGHAWEWNYVYGDPGEVNTFYVFEGNRLYRRHWPNPAGQQKLFRISTWKPYTRSSSTSAPHGTIARDLRSSSSILLVGRTDDADNEGALMLTRDPYVQEPADPNEPTGMRDVVWEVTLNDGGQNIVAAQFAPDASGVAYAVSASGMTHRCADVGTASWVQKADCGVGSVRQIAVDTDDPDLLWVLGPNQVRRSPDGGDTWDDASSGLPASELNSIVADPSRAGVLWAGADAGVWYTSDGGGSWLPFDDELPNAEVLQIQTEGRWLYATTHGRGLWRIPRCAAS